MIYTLGKREVYDKYLAEDPNPEKRKGGSVWQTQEEAELYLSQMADGEGWGIYGVLADWHKDVRDLPRTEMGELRRNARLVKVTE